ncbi:2'-5' RNA ligase family protein [Williamsia maris]|uniref:2'-5' RNA ligase superfamily protein n=1 Tax=Williamsia maris TaxID=72806 RepID=A0ABT1HG67_9NOCA|nr:2'-5' RNA ligase family protein [Williamsia maris]MCP2176867.1 2'-5' RNA ligase superfamily protein [Williamsia maris]
MAHSIELLVDPDTDAAVRRMWTALMDSGLPSQGNHRSSSNRPHITLVAAEGIDAAVDDVARTLGSRLPLRVDIGATVVFRGGRSTVARLVVASRDLLVLHREVYEIAGPFVRGEVFAHCEPDRWTPHLTVARRVTDDQLGRAIAVADDSAHGESLTATIIGMRRWDSDARADVDLISVSE